MNRAIAIACLVLLFVAAAPAQQDLSSDTRQLNSDFAKAYNAGDLDKIVAFYDANSLTLPPGEPAVQHSGLRALFEKAFKESPKRNLQLTSHRSQAFGELAYDAGEWSDDASGQAMRGHYLSVLKKSGGKWLILSDTWNVAPAPPAKEAKK